MLIASALLWVATECVISCNRDFLGRVLSRADQGERCKRRLAPPRTGNTSVKLLWLRGFALRSQVVVPRGCRHGAATCWLGLLGNTPGCRGACATGPTDATPCCGCASTCPTRDRCTQCNNARRRSGTRPRAPRNIRTKVAGTRPPRTADRPIARSEVCCYGSLSVGFEFYCLRQSCFQFECVLL